MKFATRYTCQTGLLPIWSTSDRPESTKSRWTATCGACTIRTCTSAFCSTLSGQQARWLRS